MKKIILVSLMLFSLGCDKEDAMLSKILNADGKVYVFDANEECHEININLAKDDALALWNLMKKGHPVEDRSDQGLAFFKFNLSNKKLLHIEIGQSGILRCKSKVIMIDLKEFENLIQKYLENVLIDGKKPDIYNYPK